jgi:hypothetical protein
MNEDILSRVLQLETMLERLRAGIERDIVVSDDNVASPPTDAELDTAFGTAANLYDGFVGIVDDAGAGTAVWLCIVKNSAWWYEQLTKAV